MIIVAMGMNPFRKRQAVIVIKEIDRVDSDGGDNKAVDDNGQQ